MQYENERMEFKSQLTDDIYKEVIAFTNTDGGVIYIGIDDQGNVTGIDNVDETYTRLTNGIRDAIQPATAAIDRSNCANVVTVPSSAMRAGRSGTAAAASDTR